MSGLVSTEWLAQHLDDSDLVVLDASMHLPDAGRNAHAEFDHGHIAGARFLDLATLIDPGSDVPKALPNGEQFARRMAELGVTDRSRIVLYDDSANRSSARAWFVLRMYGFDDAVILDGGLGKWRGEDRPLASGASRHRPSDFAPRAARPHVRTKAQMLANISDDAEQVVDARGPERFAGTATADPHGQPGGHIPGSRNLPFARLFAPDGTYKAPAELRREFEAAGIDSARPVTATCGSGVTAAVLLFALHLLGREDGALYDGSWLEWGSDPGTPKATGPATAE